MISYRNSLKKIGMTSGNVSYKAFASYPMALRQAIKAMSIPRAIKNVTEHHVDEDWTEECQGVAWDGRHWMFTSNGSPKAIYSFDNVDKPTHPSHSLNFDTIPVPPSGKLYHIGAISYYKNKIYVDHFSEHGGQDIAILTHSNGGFSFEAWIPLESVQDERVGLVGINPWDGMFYTSFGHTKVDRLFIHDRDGSYTGRDMRLLPGIKNGGYVQGGVFTPNGHLYISSGKGDIGDRQHIYCYSALNGKQLDIIEVLSLEGGQELEGICYADINRNNKRSQLHVILLENKWPAKDNIFFKSFAATLEPDLV